jgi:hypothetical protein
MNLDLLDRQNKYSNGTSISLSLLSIVTFLSPESNPSKPKVGGEPKYWISPIVAIAAVFDTFGLSTGFCHWPKTAWSKPDGTWQPATANFTSLADPSATGSGLTALETLMHEAGHAAHFAVTYILLDGP